MGVIGLGKAYSFLSRALLEDGRINVVAAADTSESARLAFHSETSGSTYADAGQLFADSSIEAVYIATPPQTHIHLTCAAAAAGKHILVEKPMSLSIAECKVMIDATQKAGVQLLVGHTHSYDRPILMARAIIQSGKYGGLRHVTAINYNKFMTRSRAPDALCLENGGGAILNQGFHQVDVARLLGGGLVDTVRSSVGFWNTKFPSEGAYTATLQFRCGATATLIYSGYGRFDSDEFCGWIGETGVVKSESEVKEDRPNRQVGLVERRRRYHEHFGLVVASCEHADIRPIPEGVMIYCEQGTKFVRAPEVSIPRAEVVDELYRAVVSGEAPIHSGEWGLATQEVCNAIRIQPDGNDSRRLTFQIEHAAIVDNGSEVTVSSADNHWK